MMVQLVSLWDREKAAIIAQLQSLRDRRHLLKYFVTSNLKVTYREKLLGFLWTVLDPLAMMVVYVILVTVVFKRREPQYPVLLYSALLSWQWFVESVNGAAVSIARNAKLIQTIHFPKAILPLAEVIVGLVNYSAGLIALVPLLFIFRASITFHILWLPAIVSVQLVFTIGVALVVAMLGVYFRDIQNILQFSLRFLFYLSPAMYAVADLIPSRFQLLYYIANPFAPLFISYKNILVNGLPPSSYLVFTLGWAVLFFVVGFILFHKREPGFSKEV